MRTKRIAGVVIVGLLCLLLVSGLLLYADALQKSYAGISLRIADTGISERKLKTILEQEDDTLTLTAAWSRGPMTPLSAADLGTAAEARVIAVYGDIRQIAPMKLLSGAYLAGDDAAGCMLSADTAMALFHSVDAVGARLTAGESVYTVRGVVKTYEPTLILRNDAALYENLEFAPSDLSGGAAALQALVYRHSLTSAYVSVQSGLYARILYGLAFLPLVLALLLAARRLIVTFWRRKTVASLVYLLSAVLLLALAIWTLYRTAYWPQAYLPTRCSDFAFWQALFIGWRESWKAMTLMTPLPKDIRFFQAARLAVLGASLTAAAVFCLDARVVRLRQTIEEDSHEPKN